MTRAPWTSPRRLRPAGIVVVLVVATGVLTVNGWGARPAAADGDLSSYTLSATAAAIDVTFDQADAPAHPEGTATIPMTSSLLTNGGIGYGLSTIFWPGPLGGNLGSLLPLVIPSQVPQLGTPIPRPDAVSQVINQYGPLFNDPVKAEAHSGSQPDAAFNTFPGITLIAHADDQRVDSQATVESVSDPAVLSVGNLAARATTTLKDGIGTALATTHWLDVDIAGVVHIAKIESRAESHTDGTTAAPSGALTVAGITVAGNPAFIDETGVHLQPLGIESPLSVDPLNAILDKQGIHMFLTHPDSTKSEGSASYSTSSLLVTWHTPKGQDLTMTLGGSRVAVTATPPFEVFSAPDLGGDVFSAGSDFAPPSVLGDLTGVSLGPTGSVTPSAPSPRGGLTPLPARLTSRTFSGIAAGWLLLGLLAVAMVAAGALRLAGGVLDDAVAIVSGGQAMTTDTPLEAIDIADTAASPSRPDALAAGLRRLRRRGEAMTQPRAMLVIGGVLMPAGVALVIAGWFGASHTTRLFEEVPYLISGGLLGLAVVILGCAFYFGYWQTRLVDQQRDVIDALERIEARLAMGGTTNGFAAPAAAVVLVATTAGSLYHRGDCPVVDGRPAKDLVPVTLPTDRAPCRLCHPPH